MKDRDCRTCVYARTPDDMYDNGCTAWECEYINRQEAIKLIKSIVRCKDCKHWQGNKGEDDLTDLCKWITDELPNPDDFCSYGERKGDVQE